MRHRGNLWLLVPILMLAANIVAIVAQDLPPSTSPASNIGTISLCACSTNGSRAVRRPRMSRASRNRLYSPNVAEVDWRLKPGLKGAPAPRRSRSREWRVSHSLGPPLKKVISG